MNMNNKFIKALFSGILSLVLVFSTFAAVLAAGGGGGGGTGTGQTDPVKIVEAYLTTISGDVSSTGGDVIDGNSNVDANPIIKLVFNKNIVWDPTSNAITLTNGNEDLVDIDVKKIATYDERNNVFVSPKEPLKSGKTYILKVDNTIKANNGNTLAEKYTITFTVAGIDEDRVAAQKVEDMITALPEVSILTLADKTAIENTRKEYSNLTVDQQNFVTNVDKLTELEKMIEALELAKTVADQGAAQKVNDLINALPEVSALTVADKASVTAARKAYDGLTLAQKELVKNQAKLVELETKLAELETKPAEKSNQADTNKGTIQNPTVQPGDTAKSDNNKLPKTGESSTVWTSLFGSILLAMGLVLLTIKRKGRSDKSNI